MVSPIIGAAGITAGANLLGGALGSVFGSSEGERDYYERLDAQRVLQDRILQNQIQWRVADAKAAGIHPSLALGLSSAQSPIASPIGQVDSGSIFAESVGRAGQAIGRGLSAHAARRNAAEMAALQKDELRSRIELNLSNAQLQGARTFTTMFGPRVGLQPMGQSPASRPKTGNPPFLSFGPRKRLALDPKISPGREFEDALGEIAQILGPRILAGHMAYDSNLGKASLRTLNRIMDSAYRFRYGRRRPWISRARRYIRQTGRALFRRY